MVRGLRGLIRKTSHKAGRPPGELVFVGEQRVETPKVTLLDYDEERLEERELSDISDCFPHKDTPSVSWVNIDGLHDIEIIRAVGRHYGLHELLLEDVVNTEQRPKVEDYTDRIFIVLKMFSYDSTEKSLAREQISVVVGPKFVLSFQEWEGDVLEPVRQRLRTKSGRFRSRGADYLGYAIVDAIVDSYFGVLEGISESLTELEEELLRNPTPATLQDIYRFKRLLLQLRKSVWPLRESISGLVREETPLITDETNVFFRDAYDHVLQVIDTTETFRDMVSGMLDTYLSSVSNRMNEVMKVLTIIATIFIPITFVAGIYGMNFEVMPELHWAWGYFGALGVMAAIVLVMVLFFRNKGWL